MRILDSLFFYFITQKNSLFWIFSYRMPLMLEISLLTKTTISSRIKDQVLLRMWSILLHFSIENCNDIWLNWYDCLFFPWRIANSLLALNKCHICHVKRHSEHTIYVLGMLMLTEHEHKYMCSCQQVFVKHATNRTT